MVSAFGGIHAHVFLLMNEAERTAVLDALIGRELRCVVGGNGAGGRKSNKGFPSRGHASDDYGTGKNEIGWSCSSRVSGVRYRVERLASANPAADLAYMLS